jgi:hypothetical protein
LGWCVWFVFLSGGGGGGGAVDGALWSIDVYFVQNFTIHDKVGSLDNRLPVVTRGPNPIIVVICRTDI